MAVIKVGIADSNIAKAPDSICTLGLGSCVGVTLFDDARKIVGMVHVMLPSTELARSSTYKKAKFADSGVPELVDMLVQAGASRMRLKAKMAGGARMFSFEDSAKGIGQRNTEACKDILRKLGIPIVAEDTGGSHGRTIEAFPDTGVLEVRTVSKPVIRI
ncbi:chemotaxis protein CheD [Heliobacterium undosum]|uniref:Probable chemoreceptor glutamine deamidase CheD n=1 Tax=Heliomicrobium undosum TaxID=121734 RepID=A0A845KX89_9FIRM|nr:chemotaxis protein CheD [Heliomicrobium undosum]MZP28112.1 chemotaxis protein CheD [Heliomicrobium undosum]